MQERRRFFRGLLSRLLEERSDSDGLYIPRGEAGMRRMIHHLIAMRAPDAPDDALDADIRAFLEMEHTAENEAKNETENGTVRIKNQIL
ncbi:MAG: hypothetical protein IKU34_05675 [Clostridia bacterium]|nr:hypothetical protein [Clostridia bacterium]